MQSMAFKRIASGLVACLAADRYCYQCIFKIRTGGMIYAGMAV